ncbi:glycerol-3-phosphate dehydrogenase (NAD(P)+) [Filimonas lacunae]|uniref:Glycerol-3-phosphate dehydrogenase n=1 Tax=Filimonas lacunae TaxID=477680 RepID=A0A173MRY8_9BACT|nr:NAD(P)H-dependent glycerol-3-phosphate dehydrogenase [Filimonas lacunae]BAV10257.1 glycerol-3-phosphate dehydrogenase [Filimonas lacunae]SIT17764.1 glycerol-3-phosphate dehydrogenase (NAD(P)+) [Filimonas lacunae]
MQFGIIGSGSWATALAKILTDGKHCIAWWVRNADTVQHIRQRHHNPHYLSSAYFDNTLLNMYNDVKQVVAESDVIVIAVPSAYVHDALQALPADAFAGKKVVSAVKGILPGSNQLLHEYLAEKFQLDIHHYFTVLGPCHAEEVAAEKLSYLTFSGLDENAAAEIAAYFHTDYINTVVNHDVVGAQYAAVLKNIYALGAGIAHGLEYGDNFLSVYIANAANEMNRFLQRSIEHYPVGVEREAINYTASVYLGDLLVTCYSLYSRNRMFGNMIGKGYSVKAATLELNMVAEGYNASKCVFHTNQQFAVAMPVAATIYEILWEHLPAAEGFAKIEAALV